MSNVNDNILESIKKLHGIAPEDDSFDPDITMFINAALLPQNSVFLSTLKIHRPIFGFLQQIVAIIFYVHCLISLLIQNLYDQATVLKVRIVNILEMAKSVKFLLDF